MSKKTKYLIILMVFNFCTITGKNFANIGFFAYLSKLKFSPNVECLTYSKTVNYTSSNGTNNSYTCSYKPDSISMECVYTTAITEDNTSTTTKTEYFNSTEDFILRTKNFGQSTVRYSQINKDIASNKFFQYDTSLRLKGIIQSDAISVSVSEYDTKNRYTKGIISLSNGICQVPFTNSYDDTNLYFKQTFSISQTSPSTNFICYFISTSLSDQITEITFDKNYLLTKKVVTSGTSVTTETYTTKETAQACTGSDGTPYSAPIIQKFNSTGAAVGETASLTGINFDTDPGANTILFANGIKTFAASATSSSLSFIVPAGATSGQITITNRYGTGKSKNTFYVYKYFLYAVNNISNSLSSAQVDISDGSLISTNTLNSVGNGPRSVASHPNGKFIYVCSQNILAVDAYSINASTGVPTFSSTANAGNGARTIVIDSNGNYLFVLNSGDMTISRFSINQTNGNLTSLGSALNVGVPNLYWMATHPSFPILYVSGNGSSNIYAYSIDSSGNLTALSGSPYTISASPKGITVHPNGYYVYTANTTSTNSVSRLLINQLTGILSSETFYSRANSSESVTVDPTGKYLYSCNDGVGEIYAFQVDQTTGVLTALNTLTSPNCRTVIADPSGRYVYTSEDAGTGKINKFSIGSDGSLTSLGSISIGTNNPQGMAFAKTPQ